MSIEEQNHALDGADHSDNTDLDLSDLDLGRDETSRGNQTIDYHLHLAEEARDRWEKLLGENPAAKLMADPALQAAFDRKYDELRDEMRIHMNALDGTLSDNHPAKPPVIPAESWSPEQRARLRSFEFFKAGDLLAEKLPLGSLQPEELQ